MMESLYNIDFLASLSALILGILGIYYSFKLANTYQGGIFEKPWLYILYGLCLLSLWALLLSIDSLMRLNISSAAHWVGIVGGILFILGVRMQVKIWERGMKAVERKTDSSD